MMGLSGDLSVSVIGQKIGRFATIATFIITAHGIWKFEINSTVMDVERKDRSKDSES
jgi:hypothetical protein